MWKAFLQRIPRVVSEAVKLEEISYDEMLELASMGSKVMQGPSSGICQKIWSRVRSQIQF